MAVESIVLGFAAGIFALFGSVLLKSAGGRLVIGLIAVLIGTFGCGYILGAGISKVGTLFGLASVMLVIVGAQASASLADTYINGLRLAGSVGKHACEHKSDVEDPGDFAKRELPAQPLRVETREPLAGAPNRQANRQPNDKTDQ